MANRKPDYTRGWDLPPNFEMPTAREIELDLALGSDSWQSLLPGDGLLAARVLAGHFDRVTIVDRDQLPVEARFRDGVPQSRHIHDGLLRRPEPI